MPPTDSQWDELTQVFSATLKTLMSEVWDQAKADLEALAVRAVGYWKLALSGDKDARKGPWQRQASSRTRRWPIPQGCRTSGTRGRVKRY